MLFYIFAQVVCVIIRGAAIVINKIKINKKPIKKATKTKTKFAYLNSMSTS